MFMSTGSRVVQSHVRLIKSIAGLRDAFGETFARELLDSPDAQSDGNEAKEETAESALEPYDRLCSQLRSAAEWEALRREEMLAGATCNRPECPYRDAGNSPAMRDGERIDYVLYRSSAGASVFTVHSLSLSSIHQCDRLAPCVQYSITCAKCSKYICIVH